ncbi:hypothetical protein G6F37_001702 [Rhizopus arrhizus]|nr:hypothetical protein G6F38_001935 [Rhizopus arrhizus]KAG1162917.1 hypothetical protein G6F37_001702 [Rhizopus arrhizus]
MSSIGINPSGFSKLLSTRFYAHIVHSQTTSHVRTSQYSASTVSLSLLYIPEDTLLSRLLPSIQCTRGHQWYLLSRATLWKMASSIIEELDTRILKSTKRQFLQQNLNRRQQNRNFKLISSCRRSVSIDLIMWLPMSNAERSRCIRWQLGWLPGDIPRSCPKHPTQHLSKNHAIDCLTVH